MNPFSKNYQEKDGEQLMTEGMALGRLMLGHMELAQGTEISNVQAADIMCKFAVATGLIAHSMWRSGSTDGYESFKFTTLASIANTMDMFYAANEPKVEQEVTN